MLYYMFDECLRAFNKCLRGVAPLNRVSDAIEHLVPHIKHATTNRLDCCWLSCSRAKISQGSEQVLRSIHIIVIVRVHIVRLIDFTSNCVLSTCQTRSGAILLFENLIAALKRKAGRSHDKCSFMDANVLKEKIYNFNGKGNKKNVSIIHLVIINGLFINV